uniref:Uncharacterized protein n=1 Tax=Eutreptiella gymnastica TaxID=73025 RepID=A0A7S1II18_9EUGL|mmetsp:Transcript_19095/g.33732  ORF Transcript_19095/g.33732 Transcript_19095/m.33732 type:complete len:432 (+) Transcript_19095:131-1426(+)
MAHENGYSHILRQSMLAFIACMGFFVFSLLSGVTGYGYYLDESVAIARANKIARYTAAVDYWAGEASRHFQDMGPITLNLTIDGLVLRGTICESMQLSMTNKDFIAKDTIELLHDPKRSALPNYTSLRYAFEPAVHERRHLLWQSCMATLDIRYWGAGSAPQGESIHLPLAITKETEVQVANWKLCVSQHGGAFIEGRCRVYFVVQAVCLQLHQYPNNKWDIRPDMAGCNAPPWTPVVYTHLPVDPYTHAPTSMPMPVAFQVLLRSDADPRIIAAFLTNGSLDFGLSGDEQTHIAELCFVSAVLCGVVSLGLSACFINKCGYFRPEDKDDILLRVKWANKNSWQSVVSRRGRHHTCDHEQSRDAGEQTGCSTNAKDTGCATTPAYKKKTKNVSWQDYNEMQPLLQLPLEPSVVCIADVGAAIPCADKSSPQ